MESLKLFSIHSCIVVLIQYLLGIIFRITLFLLSFYVFRFWTLKAMSQQQRDYGDRRLMLYRIWLIVRSFRCMIQDQAMHCQHRFSYFCFICNANLLKDAGKIPPREWKNAWTGEQMRTSLTGFHQNFRWMTYCIETNGF